MKIASIFSLSIKEKGFVITTNYIGVQNVEIAKERVDLRVSEGGHGIPHRDIERRFIESLENLSKIIPMCDEINIYDNTDIFKLIVCIENGKIIWSDEKLPDWIKVIIEK